MQNELGYTRWAGLAGLAGALVFFGGDMLLVGHWGAGATYREGMLTVARESSQTRLFIGGLMGPIAGCLCLLGFWHVRQNLVGRSRFLGRIVFFALAAGTVSVSVVHALLVPLWLARRYSEAHDGSASELVEALRHYLKLANTLMEGPYYLGVILLLILVLLGKSSYPRWTVLANFGLLSFLEPLADRVPAPLGAVLVGGFESLSLALFFLVSVLSTWKRPAAS